MYPRLLTSPASFDALDAPWLHQPIVYVALAALCLCLVLRYLRRAVAPIGAFIQAMAAAAVVACATGLALILLLAAALHMH